MILMNIIPPSADDAVHQEGDQSNKEPETSQQEELPPVSNDIPTEISLPPHENEFGEQSYVDDDRQDSASFEEETVQEGNQNLPRRSLRDRKPPGYLAAYKT